MDSRWFLCAIVFTLVQIVASQNNRCDNIPDGRFINDFTACDGFYTCFRGEAFPGTCPEGYYFNEEEQLCDFNWRVKCMLCPDDPNASPTLEPIEGNCDFYTLCFQGIGTLRECAEGLLFDRVLGACTIADRVDCEAALCPSNVNPATPVLVPDPADCSSYFICLNGEATPAQCAPTLLFNPETRRCDLEENVECAEGAPSPTSCPATGFHMIGNPADCVSFFVCLDGVQSADPIDCASGLIFDITLGQCQIPNENARCADGSSPLDPTTTTEGGGAEPTVPTPEVTTLEPEETTLEPEETTLEPEETTLEPEETTLEPEETTLEPEETTLEPEETTVEPEETTLDPEEPIAK
ncbi:peritrophin-44-like [Anopheles albimanus]|uniref:peritrophin-44-like n=1 Tax=Anopheles albimanus TaxID=7167 RepID=UPI0016422479|nr:peritrophin-44-like [Anopheles albimanus]